MLGCSKRLSNGQLNLYFRYRIEAAKQLFESGKIEYILVSGDNSRKNYDEPTEMKNELIREGIPEDRIVCDYAGFSTLDSVVRAKKVFSEKDLIVVSQGFHVRRAIYIGISHGMKITGFQATEVVGIHSVKTNLREYLARAKTVMDVKLFRRKPKFLGEIIVIGNEA